jgi:PIN domain nuclease of toxin-antitoxin system
VRVLLDTHAFLWALTDPALLGDGSRALLTDRANEVWVSSASAWEVSMKQRLGKLPGVEVITAGWSSTCAGLALGSCPSPRSTPCCPDS